MSSFWHWEWWVVLYIRFHLVFWKYVKLEIFHDKLQYWSSKFFIGLEISRTEPPHLHPYLSTHSFKIIFITSIWFGFLHKLLGCGFTLILLENTSHKTFTLIKKNKLISNQIKLYYIILWTLSFFLPYVEIR